MSNAGDFLLELARPRERRVTIRGVTITVREPNGLQLVEKQRRQHEDTVLPDGTVERRRRKDADDIGLAYLVSVCALNEQGAPLWSDEDALSIVRGRTEVAFPIIDAVTEFIGQEKKVSRPTSASTTGSPLPSDIGQSNTASEA